MRLVAIFHIFSMELLFSSLTIRKEIYFSKLTTLFSFHKLYISTNSKRDSSNLFMQCARLVYTYNKLKKNAGTLQNVCNCKIAVIYLM